MSYDGSTIGFNAYNDAGSAAVPMHFNATAFIFYGLPNANPGAGSKQLWYDPADSNRVKYAP